jgi:hypothetical protein
MRAQAGRLRYQARWRVRFTPKETQKWDIF